jgi:hypothetical protein
MEHASQPSWLVNVFPHDHGVVGFQTLKAPICQRIAMIRLTTEVDDKELVAAVHAQGRERVKRFLRLLLLHRDDQLLLEECADMILEELERRATQGS